MINATYSTLYILARKTRGSRQNIPLLEQGTLDVALVASLPAHEAFEGIERDATTSLKIIAAIYPTFGAFAVKTDSPAKTFSDLVGKKVSWGTKSSGLALLAQYVNDALVLDRDRDFDAVYLERVGQGAPMVLNDEVAAQWGGGDGWPNFTTIMQQSGGRLVGLSNEQIIKVNAKYPFLQPLMVLAESYPGQMEPLKPSALSAFCWRVPIFPMNWFIV